MIHILSMFALMLQPLVQPPPLQMVTFPDRVTKSPLTPASPKASESYMSLLNTQNQSLFFQSHIDPQGKNQIQIPTSGIFKLLVKEGYAFTVTDNNATDGLASITLPKGTFKAAIQLPALISKNAQLDIHDPLYHLKDTLNHSPQNKWMDIGLRPVPVPTDWRSEDGKKFVLSFKSQNIQSFHMVWQNKKQKAPFPPGINEIGPKGGRVELPGVADVTFAPNDIKEKTVFTLKQVSEFPVPDTFGLERLTYVGPVVSLLPKMKISTTNYTPNGVFTAINIKVDAHKLKGYSLGSLGYMSTLEYKGINEPYSLSQLLPLVRLIEKGKSFSLSSYFSLEQTGIIFPIYMDVLLTNSNTNFSVKQADNI